MQALGVSLPMIAVEHPLGGERPDGGARRARQAVKQIRALLGKASASTGKASAAEIGRAEPASPAVSAEIGRAEPPSVSAKGVIGRAEPASISLRPPAVEAALTDPVTIEDTPEAVLAAFCARHVGDGLPIVPPTEARVRAMLGGAPGERSLGVMPPLWRQATLEKLAVNAVMAGCELAAFPLVVAAVEAMLDPSFNL